MINGVASAMSEEPKLDNTAKAGVRTYATAAA
jgi:hypothetical protein